MGKLLWISKPAFLASIFFAQGSLIADIAVSPQEKSALVWSKIESSRYGDMPSISSALCENEPSRCSLGEVRGDENGKRRFSTAIPVEWHAVSNERYTGIFAEGAKYALLKLSQIAGASQENRQTRVDFKIWRHGRDDLGISAYSQDRSESTTNVFGRPYSTVFKVKDQDSDTIRFDLRPLAHSFTEGDDLPPDDGREPFALSFVPTAAAYALLSDKKDFRQGLEGKGQNQRLFEIFAYAFAEDMNPIYLGHIDAQGYGFTASAYGDALISPSLLRSSSVDVQGGERSSLEQEIRLGRETDQCSGVLEVMNRYQRWQRVQRGSWTTVDVAIDGNGYWYWRCGNSTERSRGVENYRQRVKRLKVWHSTNDREITWLCFDLR